MSVLLHDLLKQAAEQCPGKAVIRYKDKEISYREIHFLSDQLSQCLIYQGILLEDRVGIWIDKSLDAIIAILGALKAGACYVPFDPMAPSERQKYIINDCIIKYIIISSKKLPYLLSILNDIIYLKGVFVIDISRDEYGESNLNIPVFFKDDIFRFVGLSPSQKIVEENLAYILYTSGSTGFPKGIMFTHKASLAFVNWACQCFKVNTSDIVAAVSPLCFDLSIFDIFVTIKSNATLSIVPQGMCAFPKSLMDFIVKEKITILYSVPSTLMQLILCADSNVGEKISGLRLILFAGEVFPIKYLRRLMKMLPNTGFYNLYGPTETNVCMYYFVESLPDDDTVTVPIGIPCAGTEVFAINERGEMIKPCEVGELYVFTPNLMKGYWSDTAKTENVFIKEIFYPDIDKIVYRTGDLVSRDKKGNYIYIGRYDNMIKSRGYRIALEEIERILSMHPNVKEVAVIAIIDEKIGHKLKAVIVPIQSSSLSFKDIVNYCCDKLPQYMVPEIIEFRDHLPRTSRCKVDKASLLD